MQTLFDIGLNNAVMILLLAVPAAVSRWGRRPVLAHTLWLLVLLKLVTPPLIPISDLWPGIGLAAVKKPLVATSRKLPPLPSRPELSTPAQLPQRVAESAIAKQPTDISTPAHTVNEHPAPAMTSSSDGKTAAAINLDVLAAPSWWREALAIIWLTGTLVWFTWIGVQAYRFQRLLKRAMPAPRLQGRANELARKLGLKSAATVWLVAGAVSPMVWPIGRRPRLLFPKQLLGRLREEQVSALLAHELAHVYRWDHWVRILEVAVLGFYWWHPVAWWARRELREAEEQCCDAWVVWLLEGDGRAYAEALVHTVEFFSKVRPALPVAASGIGQVSHLRRRLTMIMQGTTPRRLSVTACLGVMGIATLLFVRLPLAAQQPPLVEPQGEEKGSTDEQIKALKHKIELLELQRAERRAVERAKKSRADELDQARSKVATLEKQVAELQAALAHAQVELRHARNFLERATIQTTAPAPVQRRVVGGMISVPPNPSGFDERLDRIMKEIDELRSEIRRQKSGVQTVDFTAALPSPDDAGALNNEAWNIAISDGASPDEAKKAVELARKACEKSDWKNGYFLDTLAAAYARLGHYDEAVKWQQKALEAGNLGSETEPGQARLKLYQEKKPYNGNQPISAPVAK